MGIKLYNIKDEYIDFLHSVDPKVPIQHYKTVNRPYVGILLNTNGHSYFVPLSSPKPKFKEMNNQIDFLKIEGGNLGALNFNNMIPTPKEYCTEINIMRFLQSNNSSSYSYGRLLQHQVKWISTNYELICNKAERLYNKHIECKLPQQIKNRCVNFPLLEKRLEQFNNKEITPKEVIPPQKPKIKISFLERTNISKDNGKGR